jgi:spermidine dehydrogenase
MTNDDGITRRDFLNGAAMAVGSLLPGTPLLAGEAPQNPPGAYYPPALTGLRGSHPGSFETAHALRNDRPWTEDMTEPEPEPYDLIIVGAGISGLSAAYFYREVMGAQARILILDNHDDFGGHAKRNEFHSGSRLLLGYGGTQSIEAPARYSQIARGLLTKLGVETQRFYKYYDQELYRRRGLGTGVFFDRATFGVDQLLVGAADSSNDSTGADLWLKPELIARMPIAPAARADLLRLVSQSRDYLAALPASQRRDALNRSSYKEFLLKHAAVHPDVIRVLQAVTHDEYCVGIDAVSARTCRELGLPGFSGTFGNSQANSGPEEPYIFHFPDGNASIARLLVRALCPDVATGNTMEDIVTTRFDYSRLDRDGQPVRIRLNSTAVHVEHDGPADTSHAVRVTYVRAGNTSTVRGRQCVLACYNAMIPHLCPELPADQKEALAYAVKQPLVYANIQLRNALAFDRLHIHTVHAPGSYFSSVMLDYPVSMGTYHAPAAANEACLVHLARTPCSPGLPCKDQFRAGRAELLATSFAEYEQQIRKQLTALLAPGGFKADSDITAITVNRWPHGYAYEYNDLFEPQSQREQDRPCVLARQRHGQIAIANSDAAGEAYTNAAIDQAHRAVSELLSGRKPSG